MRSFSRKSSVNEESSVSYEISRADKRTYFIPTIPTGEMLIEEFISFCYVSRGALHSAEPTGSLVRSDTRAMRKIIISPCNYAAGIICNTRSSPPRLAHCFPTRSIEMAFDQISIGSIGSKSQGRSPRIRCSPLPPIHNHSREFAGNLCDRTRDNSQASAFAL